MESLLSEKRLLKTARSSNSMSRLASALLVCSLSSLHALTSDTDFTSVTDATLKFDAKLLSKVQKDKEMSDGMFYKCYLLASAY